MSSTEPTLKDAWRRIIAATLYAEQNEHAHVVIGLETANAIVSHLTVFLEWENPEPAPPESEGAP